MKKKKNINLLLAFSFAVVLFIGISAIWTIILSYKYDCNLSTSWDNYWRLNFHTRRELNSILIFTSILSYLLYVAIQKRYIHFFIRNNKSIYLDCISLDRLGTYLLPKNGAISILKEDKLTELNLKATVIELQAFDIECKNLELEFLYPKLERQKRVLHKLIHNFIKKVYTEFSYARNNNEEVDIEILNKNLKELRIKICYQYDKLISLGIGRTKA